jgi:hypothetical protein
MTDQLVPAGGDAVAQEIRQIETLMRDDRVAYERDGHADRYLALLRARDGGEQPPAAPSALDAEISKLTALMRTDRRAYERDGHDARLLELLRQREGTDEAPAEAEEWRRPADEATRRDLGPAVVAELERTGDFAQGLRALQDNLLDMLASVNEGGQVNDFVNTFDGLPNAIQSAVYLELARGAPTFAEHATDEHLAALEAEACGPALIEAWGSAAARKFGIARARWARCIEGLSAADHDKLAYFFNHSQPVEQAAVIWHLAGD